VDAEYLDGVSDPYLHDGSARTESQAEGDPLSDDAVFHRNRDQLYHPPAESGRRSLLVTAAILTFCVVLIILYMLLDTTEPRALPGSEPVGRVEVHRQS
ncbi:MAG: hypothetical protein RBU27_03935, partial [Bacteroidota bacterium]|nr:hypothetical protein [Bacteroidota bacterium]